MEIANYNQKHIKKDIWQNRNDLFQSFLDNRLVVSVSKSIHLLNLDNIMYLSAESNYCNIFLDGKKSILSSKTLKYYELILLEKGFLRVHAGYLVNLKRVLKICKTSGYNIQMDNGKIIPISSSFKNNIFNNSFKVR